MNPSIDKVVQKLRDQDGVHIDLQKQLADGTYEHASDKDLYLLNSKTMLLSAAQTFKDMKFDDKLKAAIDLKNRGNRLFQKGDYPAAQELYLQALTASEFGTSSANKSQDTDESMIQSSDTDDNIDELVVPVLCNMAACALKLDQFVKAARFCDEALRLRPLCKKALLRRGVAFLHLKEYDLCISSLEQAKEVISSELNVTEVVPQSHLINSTDSTGHVVSHVEPDAPVSSTPAVSKSVSADLTSIEHHLLLARHARQEERQRLKQQRANLQRAFGSQSAPSGEGTLLADTTAPPRELSGDLLNRLLLFIERMVGFIVSFLVSLVAKLTQSRPKED